MDYKGHAPHSGDDLDVTMLQRDDNLTHGSSIHSRVPDDLGGSYESAVFDLVLTGACLGMWREQSIKDKPNQKKGFSGLYRRDLRELYLYHNIFEELGKSTYIVPNFEVISNDNHHRSYCFNARLVRAGYSKAVKGRKRGRTRAAQYQFTDKCNILVESIRARCIVERVLFLARTRDLSR